MPIQTAQLEIGSDGEVRCQRYGDRYASVAGAWAQAQAVFVHGIDLPTLSLQRPRLRLLELGFGLGTNFLASVDCWRRHAPTSARLDYLAIEAHPLTAAQWRALPERSGVPAAMLSAVVDQWPEPVPGLHVLRFDEGRVRVLLWLGDVAAGLDAFDAPVDGVYLDGFAPDRNPDMWSPSVFRALKRLLPAGARAASYSVACKVRDALAEQGFAVRKEPGFAGKRERLVAVRQGGQRTEAGGPSTGPAAVVGAGIAGLTAAAALRAHGADVTLFDPGGYSLRGASGNAAALLHAESGDHLPARLHDHGLRLALRQLRKAAQADPELARLDGVRDSEGRIVEGGWVCPARLATWLARELAMESVGVHRLVQREDGWEIRAGRRRRHFAHVVLANGMDSVRLWPGLAASLAPLGGQVEELQGDFSLVGALPRLGERWLVPMAPGRALAGASFLPGVQDRRPRAGERRHTLQALRDAYGHWVADWRALQSRAGVRVVSPDRRPLSGPLGSTDAWQRDGWPQVAPGLWASLAHGSRGFVSAFLAAELLAAAIAGLHPAVPRDLRIAVDPRRFSRR